MAYEVWDQESANMVGEFPSQDAALSMVRAFVLKHGHHAAITWALGFEDEEGETDAIAAGVKLLQLAVPGGVGAYVPASGPNVFTRWPVHDWQQASAVTASPSEGIFQEPQRK